MKNEMLIEFTHRGHQSTFNNLSSPLFGGTNNIKDFSYVVDAPVINQNENSNKTLEELIEVYKTAHAALDILAKVEPSDSNFEKLIDYQIEFYSNKQQDIIKCAVLKKATSFKGIKAKATLLKLELLSYSDPDSQALSRLADSLIDDIDSVL